MKLKKILLVSYYFEFSDSTGSLRPRAMAKYLPQFGIDVSVLAYHPQNTAVSFNGNVVGVRDITRDSAHPALFYAWRIWQKTLSLMGRYRGPFEYWRNTALKNADKIIKEVAPDAILVTYPSIEALEIGIALREKYNLPLISDFRDGLLFESLEEDRLRQYPAVRRHYEQIETKVVQLSDLILTVSEPISAYFREHYSHPNVMTLHNGYDPEDIAPDMTVQLPDNTINFVHTGRLGTSEKGRGVDSLRDALQIFLDRFPEAKRKCMFHFIGQLSKKEHDLLAPLIELGIVKLWGHVPRSRALGFQRKADILLLVTGSTKTSVATGKLFEYLATGKPILALTGKTEAARIIQDTRAGVLASSDKPDEIAEAIEHLVLTNTPIEKNQAAIIKFARDKQMEELGRRINISCQK